MFDYYYGYESEQFEFIQMPRALFNDEKNFSILSLEAKVLYSFLLDRMKLSRKNNWFDEHNRVYIIYPLAEICGDIKCGLNKAGDIMKELDETTGVGLISRVRRGQGKADIIYVKNFIDKEYRQSDVPNKPQSNTDEEIYDTADDKGQDL